MIYYNRYPQDYDRDTSDLTLAEHGAYGLLLDRYYALDGKLKADTDSLCRVCRAQTIEERTAVAEMAARFFSTNGDGFLHHKRADEEIQLAADRAETARRNGAHGGAPIGNQNAKKTTRKQPSGLSENNPETTQKQTSHRSSVNTLEKNIYAPPVDVDRVRERIKERGLTVDPVAFVAFYESKGWLVGKSPMKNWDAALTTWSKRSTGSAAKRPLSSYSNAKPE